MLRGALTIIVLATLAGCGFEGGGARSAEAPPSVVDSSGVRIVLHDLSQGGAAGAPAAASLDLRIGSASGDAGDAFGKIVGVEALSSGAIVVADAQADQLRAFAADGSPLWTAGRRGGGPGEFTRLGGVWRLAGDSLLTIDGGRLMIFDPHGTYVEGHQLVLHDSIYHDGDGWLRVAGLPEVHGVLSGNRFLVAIPLYNPMETPGYFRPRRALAVMERSGALVSVLGVMSGTEGAMMARSGVTPDGQPFSATIYTTTSSSRTTALAARGERLVVADQAGSDIRYLDVDGGLDMIVRVTNAPRPFDRERYLEHHHERTCPAGCWQDEALPDTLATFGRILLDSAERLWVEEYVAEYETSNDLWYRFNSDGMPACGFRRI